MPAQEHVGMAETWDMQCDTRVPMPEDRVREHREGVGEGHPGIPLGQRLMNETHDWTARLGDGPSSAASWNDEQLADTLRGHIWS